MAWAEWQSNRAWGTEQWPQSRLQPNPRNCKHLPFTAEGDSRCQDPAPKTGSIPSFPGQTKVLRGLFTGEEWFEVKSNMGKTWPPFAALNGGRGHEPRGAVTLEAERVRGQMLPWIPEKELPAHTLALAQRKLCRTSDPRDREINLCVGSLGV